MEKAGAKGGIVVDNNKGTTSANSPLFSMSGDGTDDISIPMVFLFSNDAKSLIETLQAGHRVDVNLLDSLAGKLKTFFRMFTILQILILQMTAAAVSTTMTMRRVLRIIKTSLHLSVLSWRNPKDK